MSKVDEDICVVSFWTGELNEKKLTQDITHRIMEH